MYKLDILIVEDTEALRDELLDSLNLEGFNARAIEDFKSVSQQILRSLCDLVILDIGLPNEDGYRILREIRKSSEVPVILLTSRNNQSDELLGMNLGADDFVTKPFNMDILILRIYSILKRVGHNFEEVIKYRNIMVDLANSRLSVGNQVADLSRNELLLFTNLLKNKGKIVSRLELMDALWQTDVFVDDNTLTVNMTRLRNKLSHLGEHDLIKTRRGLGYMVE